MIIYHDTVLMLGRSWSCHSYDFGRKSFLVLQHIVNFFHEQKPLTCYAGYQHLAPVDFHLMEEIGEDLPK